MIRSIIEKAFERRLVDELGQNFDREKFRAIPDADMMKIEWALLAEIEHKADFSQVDLWEEDEATMKIAGLRNQHIDRIVAEHGLACPWPEESELATA